MLILKLRLVGLFLTFLTTLGWELLATVRTVLLYMSLSAAILWIFIVRLSSISLEPVSILYPTIDPASPPESALQLDEATARKLLIEYQEILSIQPNHRDALLNAAQLHQALGELEDNERLREQARLLDPNHSTFLN